MLFLPIALYISTAMAVPIHSKSNATWHIRESLNSTSAVPKRICGVSEPSQALHQAHHNIRQQHRQQSLSTKFSKRSLSGSSTGLSSKSSTRARKFTINTVFHIVTTEDQKDSVTKSMVANQFGALQAAYALSSISFRLINVTYHVNNSWASDAADSAMKTALRQGNYSTLNIYFQSNLSTSYGSSGTPTQLLGYCSLPTNVTYSPCDGCDVQEVPATEYLMDGCNVHAGSMPNGALPGYNQGKTAIHEVGHWFGLLHTFQDYSCDPNDPGDYIDDTPQESVSTEGCPIGKKSCPDCVGLDPIHNYMDYSSDACYEGFTPEQILRMQEMYSTLRLGY